MFYGIPHSKKACCETLYRITLKLNSCVLPVTIWVCYIKILICKIISTCKAYLAVNNGYLPVIPVIHKHIYNNFKWIEYTALYALLPHLFYELFIKEKNTS